MTLRESNKASGIPEQLAEGIVYRPSRIRMNIMKHVFHLLVAVAFLSEARAQDVKSNIPYANPAQERQVLEAVINARAKATQTTLQIATSQPKQVLTLLQ